MEIRKQKDLDDILDYVKSKWNLSLLEMEVLSSVLTLLAEQDYYELNKLDLLK